MGLLRYNLFWDNTPFCTMLFADWNYQGKGYGKKLMEHWENDMKSQGYGMPRNDKNRKFLCIILFRCIIIKNKHRGACESRLRGSNRTSTLYLMRIMPP